MLHGTALHETPQYAALSAQFDPSGFERGVRIIEHRSLQRGFRLGPQFATIHDRSYVIAFKQVDETIGEGSILAD